MKILVLGAGRMGHGAAFDLIHNSPGVEGVTVADADLKKAEAVAEAVGTSRIDAHHVDAANHSDIARLMQGHDSAISCVNYWYNESLSRAAIETGTNFCDLGGNNYVVDAQLAMDEQAKAAGINIIPDCGLAPGMVSILAMHGAARFERLDEIHIRVGGLPQRPEPPLDYQLVFSVEGLINEYIEVARVIRVGEITEVPSMTELEALEFEGFPPLEAFQTSGGTSTLPDTFLGKIRELDYKTIRYAGHCEKFRTMIDLGLCSSEPLSEPPASAGGQFAAIDASQIIPRKVFGELLQKHLPADGPDYVLVRLEFVGLTKAETRPVGRVSDSDGAATRLRYDIVDKQDPETGLSAMMRTTAFPASIIAQMMARGDVLSRGATPQEKAIDPDKFVAEMRQRNIKIKEMEVSA
ncbi:MAG: saccharopine dehydrogenase NADP-binding domain-containing protein [Acidobacteria bacterium]|nr:saccharopine dehydrogenase NADP-binding domain-containing protein [Acidobacteriota bacterium]